MKVMKEPKAKAMLVSLEEVNALKKAEEVLRDVQLSFGGETTIMLLETGEVITPGELGRARSILDCIATYRVVEVH